MLNIGFTGSREKYWNVHQLELIHDLVWSIVNRAIISDKEIAIHVGDANGVDKVVVSVMTVIFVTTPITVYGLNENFRNLGGMIHSNVRMVNTSNPDWRFGYLERDRKIVDNVDMLYAIWDGTSRGTKYTHDYAVKQGKRVHLAQWMDNKFRWV